MKPSPEQSSFLRASEHGVRFGLDKQETANTEEIKGFEPKRKVDWDEADDKGFSGGMTTGKILEQEQETATIVADRELAEAVSNGQRVVRGPRVWKEQLYRKLSRRS